jgi:hypothetical protein
MTKEAWVTLNVGRFESKEIRKSSSFNKLNLFPSIDDGPKASILNTFALLLYPIHNIKT